MEKIKNLLNDKQFIIKILIGFILGTVGLFYYHTDFIKTMIFGMLGLFFIFGAIKKYNNKIFYILTSIFLIMIMSDIFGYIHDKKHENITYLNENWQLSINGNLISENFNLSTDSFDTLKEGDVIELKNTFPSFNYDDNTLETYLTYTSIQLFIDNKEIFTYGLDRLDDNKMLCDGYRWISLPDDVADKDIYIKLIVSENNAVSSFKNIKWGNERDLMSSFAQERLLTIATGCFSVILAFFLLIIFMFSLRKKVVDKKLFYLSLYTFCIGLWLLTCEGILTLLLDNDIIIKYIEYVSLYTTPLAVLGFVANIIDEKTNEPLFYLPAIAIGSASFGTLVFTTTILQLLNIVHFKQTLVIFHILIILLGIFLIINMIAVFKKQLSKNKIVFIGMLIMILAVFIDICSFNIQIYNHYITQTFVNNTTTIATMILLITLFESYYKSIRAIIIKTSNHELLQRLAFMDVLTELNNRAWYEQYITNLNSNYSMISMDLNNLKETNDKLGHDNGDELIKRFADVLKKVFYNNHIIRFGGDEFLVIVDKDNKKVSEKIQEMNEYIKEKNNIFNDKIKISVSYGVAHSSEFSTSNPDEIYKLADKRMYKMKKAIKKLTKEEP